MNCQNFETVVIEIARDKIMDAATRASGLAHAQECAGCRARLTDESALARGLDALRADVAMAEASPRVEAALLSAFSDRAKSAEAAPAAQGTTAARRAHVSRWRPSWALIAAASVLLMLGLGAHRFLRTPPAEQNFAKSDATDSGTPVKKAVETTPTVAAVEKQAGKDIADRAAGGPQRPPRRASLEARRGNRTGGRSNPAVSQQREIMTSFMPLTHSANMEGMDGGQLVRVEMPRSALASFGLPVNLERANERIKADVLVGDDGMARAIRFVR